MHTVTCVDGDVVLEKNWDTMERTTRTRYSTFKIKLFGLLESAWTELDDCAEGRSLQVYLLYAGKISL